MTFKLRLGLAAALSGLLMTAAMAEDIKVGVIAPFSGPFAIWGKQFQEAIEVYQAENGTSVNGKEVTVIYKDVGGPNPDNSSALARELLVREQVDYIGGLVFTPNALAIAPLLDQSETPGVIFNAATSIITQQSDMFVRTGFTLWQVTVPIAEWAYANGIETAITAVSDYGPGIDGENAFKTAFEAKGGKVIDTIRMPLSTTDFAPFIQRVKSQAPDAMFIFVPGGPPAYALVKSYTDNGLREDGIVLLGTGETEEANLQSLGDAALGLTTAYHYSGAHDSDVNRAFKAKLAELYPESSANFAMAGAYDGMEVIYRIIASGATGRDAVEAVKGASWESPRGPVSIDPDTRHITQNVYLREVDKDENGMLFNREFETIEAVPDLGLTSN